MHFNHLISKNTRSIYCEGVAYQKTIIIAFMPEQSHVGVISQNQDIFLQYQSNFLCADCPRAVVVHIDHKNNVMMVKFVLIFSVSRVRYFSKKIYQIKTNRHIIFMFYSLKKSIGMTSKKLKLKWNLTRAAAKIV